jgi:NADH dehydrogenase FAD-containing subunit
MACKTAMPMGRRAADNLAAVLTGAAPRPFAFGDSGVCVSLGRRDGVIQHRAADGRHTGVVRGRLGAWIKESVCRFTVRALRYPRVQAVFALYDRRGRAVLAAAPPPRALPEPTA